MVHHVFDIDGTIVSFDGVTLYREVVDAIKDLKLSDICKLFFLTARYDSYFDQTHSWLVEILGHSEFSLSCRSILHPFSISSYKRTIISAIWERETPKALYFYDDDLQNLENIKRYRKKGDKDIYLVRAMNGILMAYK